MTKLLTPAQRDRLYAMCAQMFPEYSYRRVSKQGVVVFKKAWYSLHKETVLYTDLCLDELCTRISNYSKKALSSSSLEEDELENILRRNLITNQNVNIIDILYDYYRLSKYLKTIKSLGFHLLPEDISTEELLGIVPLTVHTRLFQLSETKHISKLLSVQCNQIFFQESVNTRHSVPFYVKKFLYQYFNKKHFIQ